MAVTEMALSMILLLHNETSLFFSFSVFPFFEGDIVLDDPLKERIDTSQARQSQASSKMKKKSKSSGSSLSRGTVRSARTRRGRVRKPRAIVRPLTRLWKYGIVPFVIDQGLSK